MKTCILAAFRATRFAFHLVVGLLLAVCYHRFKPALQRHILQRWSIVLLEIFNIQIEADNSLHSLSQGLIVSNHISWLDVFVLNATVPMRFVAKSEVRSWPLIGWLCGRVQTLFIERGKARDALRINQQLAERLRSGELLAVFPEGTTTDGTQVGLFHASLLQSAIDAGVQVHPFAIRYQDEQGEHSEAAMYIGEMSFGASLWNILCCRSLHVRLVITPPLDGSCNDRRTLARLAHRQISTVIEGMHAAAPRHPISFVAQPLQSLYGMLLSSAVSEAEPLRQAD